MTTNEELKTFFNRRIFDLDENEVDAFFVNYDDSTIFEYLFNKLELITINGDSEQAWLLGRILGDMSKCNNADKKIYSMLNTKDTINKNVIFLFLSGYWDQADSDINVIVDLLNTIENIVDQKKIWSEKEINEAILAVAVGYVNNKKYIESKISDISFKEQFKKFEIYLSNLSPNSPALRLIKEEILDCGQ